MLADGREDFEVRLPCVLAGVTAAKDVGAIAWGPDCAHAFWGTSSVAVALTGFPAALEDVLLVDTERIGAVAARSLDVFDGISWRSERDDLPDGVQLAGHARRLAAAASEQVFLRDEATRTWTEVGSPSFPGRIFSVAVTPRGRPLVVGENGLSHLWNDGTWCPLAGSVGRHFNVDVNDDGTRAAALSGNQGRYSIVLYDLSEL
jgi:hypothetical protein